MKRLILTAFVVLIAALTMTSCAQERLLAPLKGDKNIELVYVSKAMMTMAGGIARQQMGWQANKLASQIGNVSGVEVATTQSPESSKRIRNLVESLIKQYKMELFVESEDGDEVTMIYGVQRPDSAGNSLMLILNIEASETNLVILRGDFKS